MADPEDLMRLDEGVKAWNKWRENPKIRPDLSGEKLEGDYSQLNLSKGLLDQADFSSVTLTGVNFRKANLTQANISGAILRFANFTDAYVPEIRYLESAPSSCLLVKLRQRLIPPFCYRRRIMKRCYEGIRGLDSCYGNRIFVRDAADQDYLDTVESQLRGRWGRFWFWAWGLTDYGRSLMSVVVFASILMLGFGSAYAHWPHMLNTGGRPSDIFTPYYFSIVTYTTLGFGDVKPNNLAGEVLVSIEVILGYVTLGLLLAVLSDRIARRS